MNPNKEVWEKEEYGEEAGNYSSFPWSSGFQRHQSQSSSAGWSFSCCELDIFNRIFFFLQKWLAHVWTQVFGQIRRMTKKERLLGVIEETKNSWHNVLFPPLQRTQYSLRYCKKRAWSNTKNYFSRLGRSSKVSEILNFARQKRVNCHIFGQKMRIEDVLLMSKYIWTNS